MFNSSHIADAFKDELSKLAQQIGAPPISGTAGVPGQPPIASRKRMPPVPLPRAPGSQASPVGMSAPEGTP